MAKLSLNKDNGFIKIIISLSWPASNIENYIENVQNAIIQQSQKYTVNVFLNILTTN